MVDTAEILRIAVPSDEPGGLDAARSGRFRRSPCFTIVDIVDGLEKAPQALIGLFEGTNRGKRAVRV